MPAALRDVDPATLKDWLDHGRAILVDVREADEYAREHVPGARLHALSRFDPARLPRDPEKIMVLMCNSGNRSRQAAGGLLAYHEELAHLAGGIQAWKRTGLPVEANPAAPLPIMRQVQIAAGSLVLLGLLLAVLLSPWFALLSAFVGAGLIVAGVTGFCGMAELLQRLCPTTGARSHQRAPARADEQAESE
jgi:rhodanese-related sulfurtransferase